MSYEALQCRISRIRDCVELGTDHGVFQNKSFAENDANSLIVQSVPELIRAMTATGSDPMSPICEVQAPLGTLCFVGVVSAVFQ